MLSENAPSEPKHESGFASDRNAGTGRNAFDCELHQNIIRNPFLIRSLFYLVGTGSHHLHHSRAGDTSASTETSQDDPLMNIPSTGVNTGAGIHAQQYHGRDTGMVLDDEPRRLGGIHHDSTHHGHSHPTEGGQPSCVTCADKGHHSS